MSCPRLIIESHVPNVPEELSRYFEVVRLAPEEIKPETVADADAMIIRTRTRCNAALLAGSRVQFIATATIGTDHIDLPWCREQGIEVVSAPGCNAPAVAQYVLASLLTLFGAERLATKCIGVVGVGHVGSIVSDWARQLGMEVLECDPPRARRECQSETERTCSTNSCNTNGCREGVGRFCSLEEIASRCDIVTFHVPHTTTGPDATHHMAGKQFFDSLLQPITIVNSARGPIVDTPALLQAMEQRRVAHAIIDCWEGEPDIDTGLLAAADIATPHIAGYSKNGKIRATAAAVTALCTHFGVDYHFETGVPQGAAKRVTADAISLSYDPVVDTQALRDALLPDGSFDSSRFEALRNHYPLRKEVVGKE